MLVGSVSGTAGGYTPSKVYNMEALLTEWLLFMGESSLSFLDLERDVRQVLCFLSSAVVRKMGRGEESRGVVSAIALKSPGRKLLVVLEGKNAYKREPLFLTAAGSSRGSAAIEVKWEEDRDSEPQWLFLREGENRLKVVSDGSVAVPECLAPRVEMGSGSKVLVHLLLTTAACSEVSKMYFKRWQIKQIVGSWVPEVWKAAAGGDLEGAFRLEASSREGVDYKVEGRLWERVGAFGSNFPLTLTEHAKTLADVELAIVRILRRYVWASSELALVRAALAEQGFAGGLTGQGLTVYAAGAMIGSVIWGGASVCVQQRKGDTAYGQILTNLQRKEEGREDSWEEEMLSVLAGVQCLLDSFRVQMLTC